MSIDQEKPRVATNRDLKLRSFFKGSDCVSALCHKYPKTFETRANALYHAEKLFRLGHVVSVLNKTSFEDSDSLYKFVNGIIELYPSVENRTYQKYYTNAAVDNREAIDVDNQVRDFISRHRETSHSGSAPNENTIDTNLTTQTDATNVRTIYPFKPDRKRARCETKPNCGIDDSVVNKDDRITHLYSMNRNTGERQTEKGCDKFSERKPLKSRTSACNNMPSLIDLPGESSHSSPFSERQTLNSYQSHAAQMLHSDAQSYNSNSGFTSTNQSISNSLYSDQISNSLYRDQPTHDSSLRGIAVASQRYVGYADIVDGLGALTHLDTDIVERTQDSQASSTTEMTYDDKKWPERHRAVFTENCSYSDNEKQLLEEMTRMKKEHQHILKTYEERISKLMTKMHELRSIAEMLENSGTKASPFATMKTGFAVQNTLADHERTFSSLTTNTPPPPLPPRPGRTHKSAPNKPALHSSVQLKPLDWTRIILSDLGSPGSQLTIWHTMTEPAIHVGDVETVFPEDSDQRSVTGVTLYEDIISKRGRLRDQITLIDPDQIRVLVDCTRNLKLTLADITRAVATMNTSFLEQDGADIILDFVLSKRDMEKVLHHVKRTGSVSQLDVPEYLMYQLSRVEFCREKAEFMRFQHRLHDYIYDIDQQLKDIRTACEEICSSIHLKNLLETLLAIGNQLNCNSDRGQADGFSIDVLTKLKQIHDHRRSVNLLEYVLKTYCVEYACGGARFSLPEPSHMRHAAQVSLEDIDGAISDLDQEYAFINQIIQPIINNDSSLLPQNIQNSARTFFVKARESLDTQRRHFRETKDNFLRTAAYFMFNVDSNQLTSKLFFQIWAGFLHDCKHNWKTIQRQVSRDTFAASIRTRNQRPKHNRLGRQSSKSLDSLLDIHRDNRTTKLVVSPNAKRGVDESVAKYGSERHRNNHRHERPSSPKHIISTPPDSSDIYRPIPTPPKPGATSPNDIFENTPKDEDHSGLAKRDDAANEGIYVTSGNSDCSMDSRFRRDVVARRGQVFQPKGQAKNGRSFFKSSKPSVNQIFNKYPGAESPHQDDTMQQNRSGKFPTMSKIRNTMAKISGKDTIEKTSRPTMDRIRIGEKSKIENEQISQISPRLSKPNADKENVQPENVIKRSNQRLGRQPTNIHKNDTLGIDTPGYKSLQSNQVVVNDLNNNSNNNNNKLDGLSETKTHVGVTSPMYDRLYGYKNAMVSPNTYGVVSAQKSMSNSRLSLIDNEASLYENNPNTPLGGAPVHNPKVQNTYENHISYHPQKSYHQKFGPGDNQQPTDARYHSQEFSPDDYVPMTRNGSSKNSTAPPKPSRSHRHEDKTRSNPTVCPRKNKGIEQSNPSQPPVTDNPPNVPPRRGSPEKNQTMSPRSTKVTSSVAHGNRTLIHSDTSRNVSAHERKNRSVNSLIERFEKTGPAGEMSTADNEVEYSANRRDFRDDSIAMTSTPVSRRKSQQLSVYTDHNLNIHYPTMPAQSETYNAHSSPRISTTNKAPVKSSNHADVSSLIQRSPYEGHFASASNSPQNPFPLLDSVTQAARSSADFNKRSPDHNTRSSDRPYSSPEHHWKQFNNNNITSATNNNYYRDQLRRAAKTKSPGDQYGPQNRSPSKDVTPLHAGITV